MFCFVSYLGVATHLVFSVRWRFIRLSCRLSQTYFLLASVSLERWPESDQSVQVCRLIASIFNRSHLIIIATCFICREGGAAERLHEDASCVLGRTLQIPLH